ncbi:MAG TPA: hypothetical protein VGX21_18275 [Methylomirabilota bacterium]|jgi:hypothetical protein|nr:hypothetical protein [Methylomirabilota bacterium]
MMELAGRRPRIPLLAFALVAAALFGHAPAAGEVSRPREAEYLALEADAYDPGTLRADGALVERIRPALEMIRARYPEVQGISASVPDVTRLLLQVDRSVTGPLCSGRKGGQPVRPASIGLPAVDAITSRFGGGYRVLCLSALGFDLVTVETRELLHVPSLVKLYRGARGVGDAQEDSLIGGGDVVTVEPSPPRLRVTFSHGWGDCLAGCIYRRMFFFTVEPDGSVAKAGEWRRDDRGESGGRPWMPAPRRLP